MTTKEKAEYAAYCNAYNTVAKWNRRRILRHAAFKAGKAAGLAKGKHNGGAEYKTNEELVLWNMGWDAGHMAGGYKHVNVNMNEKN